LAEQAAISAWEKALAEMEAEAAALEASLRGEGAMPPAMPWIPPDLPPIPHLLRGRVQELLRRQAFLQRQLQEELAVAPYLQQRPFPMPAAPTPTMIDVQA
jgi:hypothetical protein